MAFRFHRSIKLLQAQGTQSAFAVGLTIGLVVIAILVIGAFLGDALR
jgi:hypothetical protein